MDSVLGLIKYRSLLSDAVGLASVIYVSPGRHSLLPSAISIHTSRLISLMLRLLLQVCYV